MMGQEGGMIRQRIDLPGASPAYSAIVMNPQRGLGMEFLGKRSVGIENSYNRVPVVELEPVVQEVQDRGPNVVRKRGLGMEFVGKRTAGFNVVRKRVPGMEFIGKRMPGMEFVGKRVPGMEFVGR